MTTDAAYVEFVHTRSRALLRTAVLLTNGDRARAEDLVQTALTRAYVSWRRLREPAAAEAYVRRILVNAAINEGRRRRRRPEVLLDLVPDIAATDEGDSLTVTLGLWAELSALSPQQRAVLVLRYYEDMSEAEIATTLGCAPGTVKSHAARGLATLRSRWKASDGEVAADSATRDGG